MNKAGNDHATEILRVCIDARALNVDNQNSAIRRGESTLFRIKNTRCCENLFRDSVGVMPNDYHKTEAALLLI